jgi:FAD/FMN-containing dehydrogenase
MPSPLSSVVVEYYGGAAGRVSGTATAFPHRHVYWDIIFLAQWPDAAATETNRTWARNGAEALRPYSTGDHLLAALDQDEASGSAFGSNLARLTAIKKQYDPANVFRVNQNIRPDAEAMAL